MNNIELIVFDIAGTTLREDGEITEAFQQAMQEYGYNVEAKKVNLLMGYKKTEAIRIMLEEFEPDREKISSSFINIIHGRFIQLMIEYYSNNELVPLPNAEKVFAYLKERNIKIGLDTGFPNEITNIIINKLGWLKDEKVDFVISSNEVPEGRPHPYMIQKIMLQAGVTDAKKVIKTGDTEVDVNEGKNAECLYSIAVTTGAFSREQLEPYHPDFIIDDLNELIPILENNS